MLQEVQEVGGSSSQTRQLSDWSDPCEKRWEKRGTDWVFLRELWLGQWDILKKKLHIREIPHWE